MLRRRVGLKRPIPNSYISIGSKKVGTSRRGNSHSCSLESFELPLDRCVVRPNRPLLNRPSAGGKFNRSALGERCLKKSNTIAVRFVGTASKTIAAAQLG